MIHNPEVNAVAATATFLQNILLFKLCLWLFEGSTLQICPIRLFCGKINFHKALPVFIS